MLKKIHIENYKSLKNVDVPCTALNLLTGVNGTGKSSFIQVLRMLHTAAYNIETPKQILCVNDFGGGPEIEDIRYAYVPDGSQIMISASFDSEKCELVRITRVVGSSIDEEPGHVYFEHPNWHNVIGHAYSHPTILESRYEEGRGDVKQSDIDKAYEEAEREIEKATKKIHTEEQDAVVAFKCLGRGFQFVDAFRQKPTDVSLGGKYSSINLLLFGPNVLGTFCPEGKDVAELLREAGHLENEPSLLEKVNQCLTWVSPGARLNIDRKKAGGNTYYVTSVDYGVDGDTRMFKPQNVGFGVSYILPVLTTLLTAEKGNVIIIENPEAHLHPRGQSEIGKLIAKTVSRGVQVFVETHSDHVINGIRVAVKKGVIKPSDVNIAFFERKEHAVVDDEGKESHEIFSTVRDITVDENGSLSEYPEDFMDEWNNQLMRLMQAN